LGLNADCLEVAAIQLTEKICCEPFISHRLTPLCWV
jgi:hypothetical protein